MATELSMNGRKKIATLQDEFNNKFNYLKLTFFDASGVEIPNNKTLSEIRKSKGDDISIVASLKISTLEKKFMEEAGLIVEVSYKRDGVIFHTKEQDSFTLNELNEWCQKNGCDIFDSKEAPFQLIESATTPIDDAALQNDLYVALKQLFPDAEAKKIGKDNFLDIFIASIYPKRGSHLYFNTSKDTIKVGFYCRDEAFVLKVLSNSTNIESYASGLRILNNPGYTNIATAINAAKEFIFDIKNSYNNSDQEIEHTVPDQKQTSENYEQPINEENEVFEEVDLFEAINDLNDSQTNLGHKDNLIEIEASVGETDSSSSDAANDVSNLLAKLNSAFSDKQPDVQETIEKENIVLEPPIEKKATSNHKTKFSEFDIIDNPTINKLCDRIKQERLLPHLPYINTALEKENYTVDNHVANFFLSKVFISDQNMEGFLYVNMDGFHSNCIDTSIMQPIFSWSGVKDIRYNEDANSASIDLIAEEGELTIREEGAHSLKILYFIYLYAWKEPNDKFANEPIIVWNVIEEMGIQLNSFETHEAYLK